MRKSKYRNRKKKSKSKYKKKSKTKSKTKSKKSKTNLVNDGMLNEQITNNPYFKIGLILGDQYTQPQQRCNCHNDFNAIDREINEINQRLGNFIERL